MFATFQDKSNFTFARKKALSDTLNTRFLPHEATTEIRKTAPLFKLDDKTITLSGGESPFQIVLEFVKNISL